MKKKKKVSKGFTKRVKKGSQKMLKRVHKKC